MASDEVVGHPCEVLSVYGRLSDVDVLQPIELRG